MEYIKLKHQVAELQKEVADWHRKLEVLSGRTGGSLRGSMKASMTKSKA